MKKIVQELKDPSKYEQGLQHLDKFVKSNPSFDYAATLQKESEFFAKKVVTSLNQLQNGNSYKSTTNSDSLGGKAQEGRNSQVVTNPAQKRFSVMGGTKPEQTQNLNSSLSQMNSQL
jgi:hypothetical protein